MILAAFQGHSLANSRFPTKRAPSARKSYRRITITTFIDIRTTKQLFLFADPYDVLIREIG